MLKSIRAVPAFERDVKRLKKKHYPMDKMGKAIQAVFEGDADGLRRRRDHALTGNWNGYRELHIEADWLLIYRIEEDELELVLTRTGSHDDIL